MNYQSEKGLDWVSFSLYLALTVIGWLMIYSVEHGDGYTGGLSEFLASTSAGKQMIWVLISFGLLFIIFIIDWKFWQTFSYLIFAISLFSLVLVLLFGTEIKGAKAWFSFGGVSLQPAEFTKFAVCLALSSYLSSFSVNLRELRHQAISIGLILLPVGLIMLQPDAGSALVFTSFFFLLYRQGFPGGYLALAISLGALLILGLIFEPAYIVTALFSLGLLVLSSVYKNKRNPMLFSALVILSALVLSLGTELNPWYAAAIAGGGMILLALLHLARSGLHQSMVVLPIALLGAGLVFGANYAFNNILKPHQRDRINVWLNPSECDPQGSLYNVLQSKMAIGSGGIQGKGFLQGNLTRGNYVPEQATDFIFCTVGEEQGFIGVVAVIGLFLALLLRIVTLAERQRSNFARCYAYGVAGILFVHFIINIGMTMGLMPVIGIPLPFISKGGSSLLGFTLLVGVLLKLDSYRAAG